ncbi:hypothetical protein DFH09DRAFT_1283191 [Mycena vulgaris]|nr:hypothetical protein DFH09DRAFT_1283191 [Mycena vulgaris]
MNGATKDMGRDQRQGRLTGDPDLAFCPVLEWKFRLGVTETVQCPFEVSAGTEGPGDWLDGSSVSVRQNDVVIWRGRIEVGARNRERQEWALGYSVTGRFTRSAAAVGCSSVHMDDSILVGCSPSPQHTNYLTPATSSPHFQYSNTFQQLPSNGPNAGLAVLIYHGSPMISGRDISKHHTKVLVVLDLDLGA